MTRGRSILNLLVCATLSSCNVSESLPESAPAEDRGVQAVQASEAHEAAAAGRPAPEAARSAGDVEPFPRIAIRSVTEDPKAWGRDGMYRVQHVPEMRISNAIVTGELDKNIVRRYIRQKLPRIGYCYEKELTTDPALAGQVTTKFAIGPSGAVQDASADGINETVASCVLDVIQTIQFPKPKDGEAVQVTYPFVFQPTGG